MRPRTPLLLACLLTATLLGAVPASASGKVENPVDVARLASLCTEAVAGTPAGAACGRFEGGDIEAAFAAANEACAAFKRDVRQVREFSAHFDDCASGAVEVGGLYLAAGDGCGVLFQESNGAAGLQTGQGGDDLLVGADCAPVVQGLDAATLAVEGGCATLRQSASVTLLSHACDAVGDTASRMRNGTVKFFNTK